MICTIVLSLFGLLGLGHIYLRNTVFGIVFLIIGLIIVAVIIASELLDLGSTDMLGGRMFDLYVDPVFSFAYIILAIVSIVHLHRYAKSLLA